MSFDRYYLTEEDLQFSTRYRLYVIMQADYLVRADMAAIFIHRYKPFRKKKWLPQELDEANRIVYGIITKLEVEFPGYFKAKLKKRKKLGGTV